MGGKNPFLGIAYVVVGGICIVLGFLFTVTHLIKPRWAHFNGLLCGHVLIPTCLVPENSATTRTLHGTMTSQVVQRRPGGITGLVTTRPDYTFHFVWSGLIFSVG
jgi:hypothetical protein